MGPRRKPSMWKIGLSAALALIWLAKAGLDWGGDVSLVVLDLFAGLGLAALAVFDLRQRRRTDIEV
jgi:hypothetical protein